MDKESVLKKYHAYLVLEKSLSPNTVEAYERDIILTTHIWIFLLLSGFIYQILW